MSAFQKRTNLGLYKRKTNRKSLTKARLLLKAESESLQSAITKRTRGVAWGNFSYWDVVERALRFELSTDWARQTAAWLKGGRGRTVGGRGSGRCTPFPPHTPNHPTRQCHFTFDLIHSQHSFLHAHFNFLPSFVIQAQEAGASSWRTQKHLNVKVTFLFHYFP